MKKKDFIEPLENLGHGDKVVCKILGKVIKDAKISIGVDAYGNKRMFICQNEKEGNSAPDKLGYKYSWTIYNYFNPEPFETQLLGNDTKLLKLIEKAKTPEIPVTIENKVIPFKHGDSVTCTIEGDIIVDGKISIDADGTIFVCQNKHDGWGANDLLGYDGSWSIYERFEETFESECLRNDCCDLKLKEIEAIPDPKKITIEDDISSSEFDEEFLALINSGADRI